MHMHMHASRDCGFPDGNGDDDQLPIVCANIFCVCPALLIMEHAAGRLKGMPAAGAS
jgi:hypothetical protein